MAEAFDPKQLEEVRRRLNDDPNGALQLARQLLAAANQPIPGLHLLRAAAFLQLGSHLQGLQALQAELLVNPTNAEARQVLGALMARMPRGKFPPAERNWTTALDNKQLEGYEFAAHRYSYRGVPMVKNPFDLALYPRLLHQIRPATIIEIGTFYGGSAIWFADLTRTFGIDTHIYSVDLVALHLLNDERVTYLRGSGRALEQTLSPDFIAQLPRPLLVVEDADHERVTTLAVLRFFHPILRSGEYIVVEDGMSCPGPREALTEFFQSNGADYEVDADYCDFFGYNVTWCMNGWLRKR